MASSPPGGYSTTTATVNAAPVTTNAGPGSNQNCARWHEIVVPNSLTPIEEAFIVDHHLTRYLQGQLLPGCI